MNCPECGADCEGTVCLVCGTPTRPGESADTFNSADHDVEPAPASFEPEPSPEEASSPDELEPAPFVHAEKPRWRRRLLIGGAIALLTPIVAVLALSSYFRIVGSGRLSTALAKLEADEPGWRWQDLQAQRPTIDDDQNAALVVQLAAHGLPDWTDAVSQQIIALEANQELTDEQIERLYQIQQEHVPGLVAAKPLATLDSGHYPARSVEDLQRQSEALAGLRLARLLSFQAALQIQMARTDEACRQALAILNIGRAGGDDPEVFVQLVREQCRSLACRTLERALAQGRASAPLLKKIDERLAAEEAAPILSYMLRGHRAFVSDSFRKFEEGETDSLLVNGKEPLLQRKQGTTGALQHWLELGWLQENHALVLELTGETIALSDKPLAEQARGFRAFEQRIKQEMRSNPLRQARAAPAFLSISIVPRLAAIDQASRVLLNCTRVGLALERYRLALGVWPKSLDQLVPAYLPEVPADPYDHDKPLHYRRLKDGVLVYSVGRDGVDNEGALDRNPTASGKDIGFRLWNEHLRRPEYVAPFRSEIELEKTVDAIYRKVLGQDPNRKSP